MSNKSGDNDGEPHDDTQHSGNSSLLGQAPYDSFPSGEDRPSHSSVFAAIAPSKLTDDLQWGQHRFRTSNKPVDLIARSFASTPQPQNLDQNQPLHGCGPVRGCPLAISTVEPPTTLPVNISDTAVVRVAEDVNAVKSATAGSDDSHPTELDSDSSGVTVSSSEEFFKSRNTYYVFDPNSLNHGYYYYKAIDGHGAEEYRSERVPVEFTTLKSGRAAYRIGMARKDTTAASKRFQVTTACTAPESIISSPTTAGCPVITEASQPSVSFNNQARWSPPQVMRRSMYKDRDLDGQDIKQIVDKAREVLQSRHLDERRSRNTNGTERRVSDHKGVYLTSDEDIHCVVQLAIAEVRKLTCGGSAESSTLNGKEISATRAENTSLPRLDYKTSAIKLRESIAADPATTISVPKTSYTSRSPGHYQARTKVRGQSGCTTATVVSRQSVAQITWTEGDHHSPGNSRTTSSSLSHSSSSGSSAAQFFSTFGAHVCDHEDDISRCSLHHYGGSQPLIDHSIDVHIANRPYGSTDEESNMTSFPELRPRHCTNEWLNPPVEIKELISPSTSDLYHQGVDAHCGTSVRRISIHLGDPAKKPAHCNHAHFAEGPFFQSHETCKRLTVEDSAPYIPEKRIGSLIGSSSHRRKSIYAPDRKSSSFDSEDRLLPHLMDKICKGSHKVFSRHSPKDQITSGGVTPRNSPQNERQSEERSRSKSLREDGMSKNNNHEAAETGLEVQKRRHTCSEDNRPHVCDDDGDTLIQGPRAAGLV